MISIYEHILPKLQLQQIGIDKARAFITLDDLLHVLSIHNSTSYEIEKEEFNKVKNSIEGIKDLDLNEYDEYEIIED